MRVAPEPFLNLKHHPAQRALLIRRPDIDRAGLAQQGPQTLGKLEVRELMLGIDPFRMGNPSARAQGVAAPLEGDPLVGVHARMVGQRDVAGFKV
ncbi:MAG: hypothetical protein JW384_02170 [Nitrosomonadaceae bacterium]|nr:hypothetical protein [Nitrosomonadaceae bacterium]